MPLWIVGGGSGLPVPAPSLPGRLVESQNAVLKTQIMASTVATCHQRTKNARTASGQGLWPSTVFTAFESRPCCPVPE